MWPQRPASSTGGPGPVFCFATPEPRSAHWREDPNPRLPWAFPARFYFAQTQGNSGRNFREGRGALRACLNRQRSAPFRNPIWDDRRDPKPELAPNRREARPTRSTRQGLVRVPESNTKYGGKGGITGVSAAPVMPPTISESSGIPKGKKLSPPCGVGLHPLFTGQVFLRPQGLRVSDSPQGPRRGEGWHAGAAVVRCPDNRQGAADSIPCRVPCQNQNPPRARGLRPRA